MSCTFDVYQEIFIPLFLSAWGPVGRNRRLLYSFLPWLCLPPQHAWTPYPVQLTIRGFLDPRNIKNDSIVLKVVSTLFLSAAKNVTSDSTCVDTLFAFLDMCHCATYQSKHWEKLPTPNPTPYIHMTRHKLHHTWSGWVWCCPKWVGLSFSTFGTRCRSLVKLVPIWNVAQV